MYPWEAYTLSHSEKQLGGALLSPTLPPPFSSLQKESAPRRTDLRGADHKGSITEEAYSVTGKRKGLPALSTKVAPWRLGKWCAPADQSQIAVSSSVIAPVAGSYFFPFIG